jgi:epoxyqueuosine reductase QueG
VETAVRERIERIVRDHPRNRDPETQDRYFDPPLVGFAAASDPIFTRYKTIIGDFHQTPKEAFESVFGARSFSGGSVIAWVLPITKGTRASNRQEERLPSRRWGHTRHFGEQFNDALRAELVAFLAGSGIRAVAPVTSPQWKTLNDPRVGIASAWSERHAAYAAGLGTFSLNDGLITARGIAHRVGSIVAEVELPPDSRAPGDHRRNCLLFRSRECGLCIGRCPAGAISESGHDKGRCREYSYGTVLDAVGQEYGVEVAGCGLCQTGVPCESRVPR